MGIFKTVITRIYPFGCNIVANALTLQFEAKKRRAAADGNSKSAPLPHRPYASRPIN